MASAQTKIVNARESPKKHWVFTLNNPLPDDQGGLWLPPYDYAVLGNEVGESGTPHIQGYVIFKNKLRLNQLKTHSPQGQRAHWEPQSQYSTPAQAADYCMKDGDFKEFGELYVDAPELISIELYEGYQSDEFAEEVDEPPLKRTCSIMPSM
jgi:hypothetical protein